MSHSTTNRLQQTNDSISWIPLSRSDLSTLSEQRGSSPKPVSMPHSRTSNDYMPTHNPASPRSSDENDDLLHTNREETHHPSVSSMTNVTLLDRKVRVEAFDEVKETKNPPPAWLPYTLRRPFLVVLALVSLALSVILVALCWYSAKNHGLGKDDRSIGLLVGWRYTPTIIAVLFTQALVITAEDVKRTEAFARMAYSKPISSRYTLSYIPKVWLRSVFEGFSRRSSGGYRRWMLAFSSLAAGVSLLIITTFSSSVFVAKDVLYQDIVQLQRYVPDRNGTIALSPKRDTYFHTISGFLYNASTSIWVSDSHVVLPFVPANSSTDNEPLRDGSWEAETTIMQLENSCVPMNMTDKTVIVVNYSSAGRWSCGNNCTVKSKGFKIRSADGCEVQMQTPIAYEDSHDNASTTSLSPDGYRKDYLPDSGGMFWTNMSSSYVSWQDLMQEHGNPPAIDSSIERTIKHTFIYSMSDQCHGRDLLVVTPPWWSDASAAERQRTYWANFTVRAEVCTALYYEASLPVTMSVSGGLSKVLFDPSEFKRRRKPISKALLDFNHLDDLAFREAWPKYMTAPVGVEKSQGYQGASILLGEHFSLNLYNMLQNSTLVSEASRLRSRFFGELVLSSLLEADMLTLESVSGEVTLTDRRIMVVTEIAITLVALFLLTACYLSYMCWSISSGHRPLNLRADPATISGTTSAINLQSKFANDLRLLVGKSRARVRDVLGVQAYTVQAGTISEVTPVQANTLYEPSSTTSKKNRPWKRQKNTKKTTLRDWRPSMLHKTWLSTFLFFLVALAITLLILRKYAMEKKLYRTAFVYQVNFGLFNTGFSPNSVIAALVAVAIGLLWDGIDKPLRTLQPYLSMSRGASVPSRGVSFSYQTSYWVWASMKASLRRHWILSLVTVGTFLVQILVVSMAAVFERQTILHEQATQGLNVYMYHPDLLQTPFGFGRGLASRPFYLDESTLETTQAGWLYKALDEITLQNAPPTWTKDEWVLTPVNMRALPNATIVQKTGPSENIPKTSDLFYSSANVTVTTSALRSRLECSSMHVPASGWLDRAEDVFSNRTNEKIHGYVLPATLFEDKPYKAPVFSVPRRMACCTNGTNSGNQSVIAYWSSSSPMTEERPAEPVDKNGSLNLKEPNAWSNNFTIKWIVGQTASTVISGANPVDNSFYVGFNGFSVGFANETLLYFTEEPQMSILNCMPIIEQTNMSITVARSTSQVLETRMLAEPQPAPGAWDYAWDIVYPRPSSNSSRGNVSYGVFFTSQLLTASHIIQPPTSSSWLVYNRSIEDLSSERFNIRDTDKGINMDFMSYANFHLANKDPTALLNSTALFEHSEKTFQTFFKHFAATGKWNYGGVPKSTVYDDFSSGRTDKLNGTLTERTEILTLNETATWLSLTIIFLLIVILVVLIVALQIVYPSTLMQHHVECLADVLLMVAGSDQFVKFVHENGIAGVRDSNVKTRLGWFRDKRGVVRWGIELADGGVEWVDGPEESLEEEVEGRRYEGGFWRIFGRSKKTVNES